MSGKGMVLQLFSVFFFLLNITVLFSSHKLCWQTIRKYDKVEREIIHRA